MPSTATDFELLRAFEPIVKYTKGEQFFPMDVARYIRNCSLWVQRANGLQECLVPRGALTPELLVQPRAHEFGALEFLRFVAPQTIQESVGALSAGSRLHQTHENVFKAGTGRLARGGLLPRFADAIFSLSLLARGRVPGAVAAQAELQYDELQRAQAKYVYHGRVVCQNGWTVLQYWFFLAFNSWRSGFQGVNDHEADWELVNVYLYAQDGALYPEWVAYASHDFHGDDLRRRWDDDAQVDKLDAHPIVYAGAGSHAAYFRPGEYQAQVSLPLPKWMQSGARAWNQFWWRTFGIGSGAQENPFRIPFVDYARGDGLSIGPGQNKNWEPDLISEATSWVREYRGLWGLYARDPISGENAPAGPMYNRDGTPRSAWFDPLGFAGLSKVPPPPQELIVLRARTRELEARQTELAQALEPRVNELRALDVQLRAMQGNPHLAMPYETLQAQAGTLDAQVRAMRREQSENRALLETLAQRRANLRAGVRDDPRAHIAHLAQPVSLERMRFNRLAELWAALSVSLMLIVIGLLALFAPQLLVAGIVVLVVIFILLEAVLRGTYMETINTVAVVLAIIGMTLLLAVYWREALALAVIAAALFLLFEKIRELRE